MKLFRVKSKESIDSDGNPVVKTEFVGAGLIQDIYEDSLIDILEIKQETNFRVIHK